ncbi:hypothetical protein [Cognatishimia sp. MH4019]|uniref:hypothetical protein n=1 Tax=Cognatishimia sp. MH4019 TaxID=2854030 RepID=UPI001CD61FA7|nr:hypothetical protein [Cognatishimia sp. MH4019]
MIAIVIVTGITAARAIRADNAADRGLEPGDGDHIIDVNYSSGLGGQQSQIRVPRDPQEYAKTFVPQDRKPKEKS